MIIDVNRVPFAFETITVSSTALGFTTGTAFPDGMRPADLAVCSVETDAIRYRADGIAPDASTGHKKAADSEFTVYGTQTLRRFRAIRVTLDATLRVTYYRQGD